MQFFYIKLQNNHNNTKYSKCLHPYSFIITLKIKLKPVILKWGYAKNMFPDATFGVRVKNSCSIVINSSSLLHLSFKCSNIVLSMMCTYLFKSLTSTNALGKFCFKLCLEMFLISDMVSSVASGDFRHLDICSRK